jgi:hypothetical protein
MVGSCNFFDSLNGGQVNGAVAPTPGSLNRLSCSALTKSNLAACLLYDVPVVFRLSSVSGRGLYAR